MRASLLALATLLIATSPSLADDTVVIESRVPEVGDRIVTRTQMSIDVHLGVPTTERLETTARVEVLIVEDGRIDTYTVELIEHAETRTERGDVVAAEGGGHVVDTVWTVRPNRVTGVPEATGPDAVHISQENAETVASFAPYLGIRASGVADVLAGRELEAGLVISLDAESAARILSRTERMEYTDPTLTVLSIESDLITVAASARYSGGPAGNQGDGRVEGLWSLDPATGRPTSSEIRTEISVGGNPAATAVRRRTYTYRDAD